MAVSKTVIANLRGDLIERLLSFSRRRCKVSDIPGMQHSVVIESNSLETMNYMVFTQMLPGILNAIVLGAVLAYLSLSLLLILVLVVPALMMWAQLTKRFIRRAFVRFQAAMGD